MDDRIRVLYVDDEPDLLDITKLYLERSGEFEVGISVSAERALDNSGIGSYDAIVSDYLMPGMDGIAFLRAVRERFGDIPFILFTGRGREDVVIRALNEGVDFYLQKGGDPKVQFAELVHKIRQGVRRRRAEKALREGEEKYRSIVETINDWIWETDLEGNHTYSNSAVERMLGYTADEIIGSSSSSHIHPDDVSRVRELIAESTREKLSDPYTTVIRWLHRDGSVRLFESAIIPMVNGDGEITGFRGIDRDITERINSEEALRESEKRYRALFENANDAITVNGLSPDGMPSRFIDVNANACRLTEYTREELLSMTPLSLDDPATWEEARSCMRTLMEKRHHVFERTHLRKDGTKTRVEVSAHVFSLDNRTVVLSIVRDITDRKEAEDALHESEERYRLLVENTNDVIYTADLTGIVTSISPQIARYGYSPEDIVSRNLSSFVVEEDLPLVLADLEETVSTGQPTRTAFRAKDKYGGIHWLEDNGVAILDESGHVAGVSGILRDITDRKEAEDALRESEKKYRLLADNIQDVIWTADLDMRLTYISPSVTTLRGITPEEAMREPICDALTEESFKVLMESRQQGLSAVQGEGPLPGSQVMDLEFWCRDGSTVWTETVISPVFDRSGQLQGVMGVMRDITSRKQAEDALRKANRNLNLLTSITRHDISNQLLVINGFAGLLGTEIDDPSQRDQLSRIGSASQRIAGMIQFTREYGNIGAEAPAWHDLPAVLESSAEEVLPEEVTFACDIPAGTEVFADPMFSKVFFNLLDNAVRHGRHVTGVRVSSHQSDGDLVIIVEDDGCGIRACDRERIFEKGFGNNTGLGLSLVREILSLTGISIRETGEEGAGACFEITVPAAGWRIAGQ